MKRTTMVELLLVAAMFGMTLLLSSCQPVPENRLGFEEDETEILIALCLDTTGSFEHQMLGTRGEEGKGYRTFVKILDRFHRDHQRSKNRLVVTRIYGSKKCILIDAEPDSFTQRFPAAESFKDFLLQKPDPGGSRVYDSLRDTVDYMILQHRNAKKLKSMLLVFSDMDDNVRDSAQSKDLLIAALRAYAKAGGLVGIYGCELNTVPEWSRILDDCTFKNFVVEPDIKDNPKLPVLD